MPVYLTQHQLDRIIKVVPEGTFLIPGRFAEPFSEDPRGYRCCFVGELADSIGCLNPPVELSPRYFITNCEVSMVRQEFFPFLKMWDVEVLMDVSDNEPDPNRRAAVVHQWLRDNFLNKEY